MNMIEELYPTIEDFKKQLEPNNTEKKYELGVPDDNVNHPAHYQGRIECIDAIKEAVKDLSGIEAVCVSNVLKYLWRYRKKNGIEDLKKARWYLNKLIEEEENF